MDKLFRLAGFVPFLLIVFFNAFVDLGHKILIQNTIFKIHDGQTQIILTAIVNGLILLPFVLLFTPSGFLSDKYAKPRVMRISAAVAVGLTLLITLSYYLGWFQFAFALTFALAVQSAIYSPAKYGYIKELVGKERLASGNAAVQAVTIVAILSGIFVFSMLFERGLDGVAYNDERDVLRAIAPMGWVLVACALAEWWLTRRLRPTPAEAPERRFDWRRYARGRYLRGNFAKLLRDRTIWLSIVGLSVFWGISQVVLAAFPAFAKETLSPDQYGGHTGRHGLLRHRHHHRLPDRRPGVQASYRDWPWCRWARWVSSWPWRSFRSCLRWAGWRCCSCCWASPAVCSSCL